VDLRQDVAKFQKGLRAYLEFLDLPTDNVLVEMKEREKVIYNMAMVIDNLNNEQKEKAYYISKFIASCAAGLFDAALNYLWNETIINLQRKIVCFDLNYFFDSTITNSDHRSNFRTEEDLKKLDDWELIRGCRETGLISDIGFKHLDYIRDMRNFASAAHPNQTQLTGLQLATWLETCIIEVLAKEPSGPVLEIKRLLNSIRTENLDKVNIIPTIHNIQKLPEDLAHSLLRAIFGMYTDTNLAQNVRDNIDLISKAVWNRSDSPAKKDIGLKYAIFSVNAEQNRKELAKEFLFKVDGLSYLAEDQLAAEINEKLDSLLKAHYDFNNFYNEEPHARTLSKLIPSTGNIPDMVRHNYVKTLIICRLGNSYGVSFAAQPYYDKLISMFRDYEIIESIKLLNDMDILSMLETEMHSTTFSEIANQLEEQTSNEVIKQALKKIRNYSKIEIKSRKAYRDLMKLISA
jgi:hypothetical protein